jgi:hypothetical protein
MTIYIDYSLSSLLREDKSGGQNEKHKNISVLLGMSGVVLSSLARILM